MCDIYQFMIIYFIIMIMESIHQMHQHNIAQISMFSLIYLLIQEPAVMGYIFRKYIIPQYPITIIIPE